MIGGAEMVELAAGESRLVLAPTVGGGVARYAWRGVDLLRPATTAGLEAGDPLVLGNFPLAPFAGRIARGRFLFEDRRIALTPNLAGEGDAIHGQTWRLPWRLETRSASTARLTVEHAAGEWPWDYAATQDFALGTRDLVHTLTVINRSTRPMPAGLGLHPYFPRRRGTRLWARVSGVFLAPDQPPAPSPTGWDWNDDRRIEKAVDHQFNGWGGLARVTWPDLGLALEMTSDARFLVVYAPPGQDYFCVEPVCHQLNAVNLSPGGGAHGMTALAPGESLSICVRFAVTELSLAPEGAKAQK